MNIGVLIELFSVLCFSVSNALWRKPLMNIAIDEAIFYRSLFTVSIFICVNMVVKDTTGHELEKENAVNISVYLSTFVLCCVSYFGLYFFNKAIAFAKVGVVTTTTAFGFIVGQITALCMGESIKMGFYFSFALFAFAILLSSYQTNKKFTISKGILFALVAALVWGTTLTLLAIPAKQIGAYKVSLLLEFAVLAMSFLSILFSREGSISVHNFKVNYKILLLIALLSSAAILLQNMAFTIVPAYLVSAISSITHIVTIIAAYIIFKEKMNRFQLSAALVVVFALILLIDNL